MTKTKEKKVNNRYLNNFRRFYQMGYDEAVIDIISELDSNPNQDGSVSPNIQHWIEQKRFQIKRIYLTHIPPKKGKKK